MTNPARRALLEAAELVSSGWTRGAEARRSDGGICAADDPDASAWSVRGALRKAAGSGDAFVQCVIAFEDLSATPNPYEMDHWNDAIAADAEEVAGVLTRIAEKRWPT